MVFASSRSPLPAGFCGWALILCLSVPCQAADVKAPLAWGAIRGQIVVDGEFSPEYIVRKGDPIYAPLSIQESDRNIRPKRIGTQPEDVLNRAVRVDAATQGLQDVFVYLKKAPQQIHPDLQDAPKAVVDVNVPSKWELEPRLILARKGQDIRVSASFGETCAIGLNPLKNRSMTELVSKNKPIAYRCESGEKLPAQVNDKIHPYAVGYWLILDHPYGTITRQDGSFEIRDLPTGKHELTIWHERMGYVVKKYFVEITPDKTTVQDAIHVPVEKLTLKSR
jgi:hypothetical protein